jgi:HEAT repeat protein
VVPGILLQSLHDPDDEVRRRAVAGVASFQSPSTLAALVRSLRDKSWTVRRQSAVALAYFPHSATTLALRRALRDPHHLVLREAIASLGKLRVPVGSRLVEFLHHEDSGVRIAAVNALGEIGDPVFRFRLSMLLDEHNPDVVRSVVRALARLDDVRLEAA